MDRERFRGALLGLAVGDAVGTTVEFKPPGSFAPVTDMVGGGPFDLPAGAWTDDTSMAMCLAESLTELGRFDPADQLRRYVRWYRDGHWSSIGRCFDIGNATRAALERFERTGEPYPGDADQQAAGNGPLMKLAPVALAFAHDPELAILRAGQSARTTHGAPEAVDGARFFAWRIVAALTDQPDAPFPGSLAPQVRAVANGSYTRAQPPAIRGGGYVVHALEAALWALHTSGDFEQGVLRAVNLGDDADTTAAIFGQLAGATYGVDGIPERWLHRLHAAAEIEAMADRLHALAERIRRAGELPPADADWDAIQAYGASLNGYEHFGEDWGERFSQITERFRQDGTMPDDIADLRAWLFLQFRSDRFESDPEHPREDTRTERRAIVARIGRLLDE